MTGRVAPLPPLPHALQKLSGFACAVHTGKVGAEVFDGDVPIEASINEDLHPEIADVFKAIFNLE